MTSPVAAQSDGRLGTVMPGAEAIHPIKLNRVDPHVYLTDTLERLVAGHPQSRIDDLMPWAYAPA